MKTKMLLIMVIVLGLLFPKQVYAEGNTLSFPGTSGRFGDEENIIWEYDEQTKTVTVTGHDKIKLWYDGAGGLKGMIDMLVLDKGAEKLVFEDCSFGYYSSEHIYQLNDLVRDCETLKEADLSGLDTTGVNSMGCMFYNCKNLEKVNLSGLDTSEVTNFAYIFRYCSSLKEIDLSSFRSPKGVTMEGMFNGCNSVEKIDISGLTSESLERLSYMFLGCENLKEIDLGEFDLSKAQETVLTLGREGNLETIKAPKNMGNVTIDLPGYFADDTGKVYKELNAENQSKVLSRVEHTHDLDKSARKEAGCEVDGSEEYYYCHVCDSYFEEYECKTEIKNIDEWKVIKAVGHDFAEDKAECQKEGCNVKNPNYKAPAASDNNQTAQLHVTFSTPYVGEEAQSLNHIEIAESDYEVYATLTEYTSESLDSYNGQVLLTDRFLETFFTNPSQSNFEGMAHVKLIKTMTPGYMYATRFNIVRKDHKPISEGLGTSDIKVSLNGKVVTATYSRQGIFEKCDSFMVYGDSFVATKNPDPTPSVAPNTKPSDNPDTTPSKVVKTQKITVSKKSAKTVVYKANSLKKKKATFSIGAKAKTKLSYTVSKYPKNAKKYISVSKKGVVTMKKGAKKGTYKVTVTAKKDSTYKQAQKVITIKVK